MTRLFCRLPPLSIVHWQNEMSVEQKQTKKQKYSDWIWLESQAGIEMPFSAIFFHLILKGNEVIFQNFLLCLIWKSGGAPFFKKLPTCNASTHKKLQSSKVKTRNSEISIRQSGQSQNWWMNFWRKIQKMIGIYRKYT